MIFFKFFIIIIIIIFLISIIFVDILMQAMWFSELFIFAGWLAIAFAKVFLFPFFHSPKQCCT